MFKLDNNIITIVTGLPRSGTSMVMKMLESGGIPPLTDRIRKADVDNPKGYYEFERVKKLPEDTKWLNDAKGKAVKVLAELLRYLPNDYEYRILLIERNMQEIIKSQNKMLIRRDKDTNKVSDHEIIRIFGKTLKMMKKWIDEQANVEVLFINYNEILRNPEDCIKKINDFFNGVLDEGKMLSAIDEKLYRNRI